MNPNIDTSQNTARNGTLVFPPGMYSNFHTRVFAVYAHKALNDENGEADVTNKDIGIRTKVMEAFVAKSQSIRAIIDSHPQPVRGQYEEFGKSILSNVVRLLERTSLVSESNVEEHSAIAEAVAEVFFSWTTICQLTDTYSAPKPSKDPKSIIANLVGATQFISRERGEAEERVHRGGAMHIMKQFISHANPIEIMRNADSFKAFQFNVDGFELNSAILGVLGDAFRSKQFIFGVLKATKDLEMKFPAVSADPNDPANEIGIADLGSGPLGFLGIMALLASPRTKVTFYESNPQSKILLDSIIDSLGLSKRATVICDNAFNFSPPEKFHAIFSETIMQSLICEPYPLLMQHARKHLIKGGVIVPEEVVLKILPMNMDKPEDYPEMHEYIKEGEIGCISMRKAPAKFVFNAISTDADKVEFQIPLAGLEDGRYKFRIATDVRVYKEFNLVDSDSYISQQTHLFSGNMWDTKLIAIRVDDALRARGNTIFIRYQFGTEDPQTQLSIY